MPGRVKNSKVRGPGSEAWWGDRAGPARAGPCQPHWGPGPQPSSGHSSLSLNEGDKEACLRPVLSEHWEPLLPEGLVDRARAAWEAAECLPVRGVLPRLGGARLD